MAQPILQVCHRKKLTGLLIKSSIEKLEDLSERERKELAEKTVQKALFDAYCAPPLSGRLLQFYSKSKDSDDLCIGMPNWRKILSNFYSLRPEDRGREVGEKGVVLDGRYFPSIEHYFQSAKYVLSGHHALAEEFEIKGNIGVSPLAAKKAGGRRGYESLTKGNKLDLAKWSRISKGVMWSALCGRFQVDTSFRNVLWALHKQKIKLLHFERSGVKSLWGGSVDKKTNNPRGQNILGRMLMRLAPLVVQDGGREKVLYSGSEGCQGAKKLTPSEQLAKWESLAKTAEKELSACENDDDDSDGHCSDADPGDKGPKKTPQKRKLEEIEEKEVVQ